MSVNVGDIVAHLILDKSKFKRAMDGSSKDIAGYISSTVGMMAKWAARIAALGTAAFVGISIKGAEFEYSMKKTSAMVGGQFDTLSKKARQLGKTTAFSAKEAADAMYNLASAGMKAHEVVGAIEPALLLAGATSTDLTSSTAILASTMSIFSLKASDAAHIADVYAKAIDGSQLTMGRLTEAMKFAGPIGDQLGWTFEKTTAALMAMSQAGIFGSMAGTGLRMGMATLAKQGDNVAAALKRLGVAYEDINPQTTKFSDIIKRLSDAGLTDLKDGIDLFGTRAQGVMMQLIKKFREGEVSVKDFGDTLDGAAGYAAQKYKEMMDTVWGAWKGLTSRAAEVALALFDTWKKPLKAALEDASKELDGFIKLVNDNKSSLTAFFGGLATIVKGLASALKTSATHIGTVAKAVTPSLVGGIVNTTFALWNNPLFQKGWSLGGAAQTPSGAATVLPGAKMAPAMYPGDSQPSDGMQPTSAPARIVKDTFDAVKFEAGETVVKLTAVTRQMSSDAMAALDVAVDRAVGKVNDAGTRIWGNFRTGVIDQISRGLLGMKTNIKSVFQNLMLSLTKQAVGSLMGGRGGGGIFGSQAMGGFGGMFGGRMSHTIGGKLLGSAVGGFGVSAILGGLMGGNNNVGNDDRSKAEAYTQAINNARAQAKEQAAALAAKMNSGELDMDSDLLKQLGSFQFSDPALSYHHHRRGGLNKRSKTEYWSLTNESALDAQLAQFRGLMEQVQGTTANAEAFQAATGQAAFTGSGTKVINNLTVNNGTLVADERTKDSLARDIWDRMGKLGLVHA